MYAMYVYLSIYLSIYIYIYIYVYTYIHMAVRVHGLHAILAEGDLCRKFAEPPCKWGVSNYAGGGLAFFVGGVLLHKKRLSHPAKAQNLNIIKLGFHPHTKPTCPKRGFSESPTLVAK